MGSYGKPHGKTTAYHLEEFRFNSRSNTFRFSENRDHKANTYDGTDPIISFAL